MMLHRLIILLAFVLLGDCAIAQNPTIMPDVDAELWSGARLRYKHSKHWRFKLQQQVRFSATPAHFERTLTQLGAEFRFLESLELGAGYRYLWVNREVGPGFERMRYRRFQLSLGQGVNVGRVRLNWRMQWQQRRELLPETNRFVGDIRRYWRARARIGYNIPGWKLDPEVATEILQRGLNPPRGQYTKYRLMLGTRYRIGKGQQLAVRYIYERERKVWNPKVAHIVSIQYRYTLKRKQAKSNTEANE